MSDNMANDQTNKLKDLTNDSVNEKYNTDKSINAPVTVQSTNRRKTGYLTTSSSVNIDGNVSVNTSVSSASSTNMPKQKKVKKKEVRRKRKRGNSLPTETTTSDRSSQTLDVNNLVGDLPTQDAMSQLGPLPCYQSEENEGWAQFLINHLL